MMYRVAWRSTITGRTGADSWLDDREFAQASLEAQARKWSPEMEYHVEAKDAAGIIIHEDATAPMLETVPRRPPLA